MLLTPPYNLSLTYMHQVINPKEQRRQANGTKNKEHVSNRINDKDGTSGSEDTLAAEITSMHQLLKQMDANQTTALAGINSQLRQLKRSGFASWKTWPRLNRLIALWPSAKMVDQRGLSLQSSCVSEVWHGSSVQ